jgi:hypothetical protein
MRVWFEQSIRSDFRAAKRSNGSLSAEETSVMRELRQATVNVGEITK